MNLLSVPEVDMCEYHERTFEERQDAKRPLHTLEEGDIVVLKTNPHGSDIPPIFTAKITETPRESTKELMADGTAVMADIRFKRKDAETHTFHLDNKYVHGYHSGLGRHSDIARGLSAYDIGLWCDDETDDTRLCTDGGKPTADDENACDDDESGPETDVHDYPDSDEWPGTKATAHGLVTTEAYRRESDLFTEATETPDSTGIRLETDGGRDVSVDRAGDMVNIAYEGDMVVSIDIGREELCAYDRDGGEPETVIDLSDE